MFETKVNHFAAKSASEMSTENVQRLPKQKKRYVEKALEILEYSKEEVGSSVVLETKNLLSARPISRSIWTIRFVKIRPIFSVAITEHFFQCMEQKVDKLPTNKYDT